MCYNRLMESQRKKESKKEALNRRSLALLPTPPGKGFPSSTVFFLVPDSLTDKAFVLEDERIMGSTPGWGIGNCAFKKEHIMTIEIKIKKNEMDEFEVQWIEDGKKSEAKTYYTDDEDDAIMTKVAMEEEAKAALQKYYHPNPPTFEIVMTIEIENSAVLSKMSGLLNESLTEAIEGLGDGTMVKIKSSQITEEVSASAIEIKTEHFLRELRAEDEDDYKVLADRLAALMENLRLPGEKMTLWNLHKICQKIESEKSKDMPTITCDQERKCRDLVTTKTEIATEGYMCGCGAMVDKGTELHLCQKCSTKQCPNCFDYNNALCEECSSK